MSNGKFHLAQLRHAYPQLLRGQVLHQDEFARGLLGPAIEGVERYVQELETKQVRLVEMLKLCLQHIDDSGLLDAESTALAIGIEDVLDEINHEPST